MDTYHDAMTALETNAKALGDHLAAVSTLIRLVEKESRQLKKRNKNAYAVLRKITHGKRPTSRSQPRLLAPMESELVASEAPDKGKRRKSQA